MINPILSLNQQSSSPSTTFTAEQKAETLSASTIQPLKIQDLSDLIDREIAEKSLNPEIVEQSLAIIPDLEIDPLTKEVVSTPINDALGYPYTRFTDQAKPDKLAIAFLQEDGTTYQLKIMGDDPTGKRSGVYRATRKGDNPYLPPIPRPTALKYARKISPVCETSLLALYQDGGRFWDWLQNWPHIPIVVTEGCYKALAAINQGYIALSLLGIYCGKKAGMIKPELLPYVQNRPVFLAFDAESKPETQQQLSLLGNALASHAKAKVLVAQWDGSIGKGIDDLCAVDPERFHLAIATARTLTDWQLSKDFDLGELVSLRVNTPNLTHAIKTLPSQKIIGIKSAKKTFKTELLAQWVEAHLSKGGRVIVPVHREQLAKELGNRLGLEYRTERTKEGAIFGYCLCIDSLHQNANPPFNPHHWDDCWVLLDEADQVFWHSLNSDTCKYNRTAILENLTQLVNIASKIFLVSADMNRVCIDYVQSLMETPAQTFVITNEYQHLKRPCFTFDKPQELFLKLRECIEKGQKLIVHTGGQKDQSKWGTRNLERMLSQLYPNLKILRIDRDSVAEPEHPAYGCMGDINAVLPLYDVVICSPTVETGISINGEHLEGVFCFASGSQTVDAIGQTVERVRADVPRYIWATERATLNKIGSGSTNPWALMHREKSLLKLNQSLNEADNYADFNLGIKAKHLETWAKFSAYHNQGFNDYRECIYRLLEANGFVLNPMASLNSEALEQAKEMATQSAELGHAEYCEKVAAAPILDDPQAYQALKNKRAKTEAERLSEKATALSKRYATKELSPDLVNKDSDPVWYGQLRLHFYLTVGAELLKERDQDRIQSLAQETRKIFAPDLNRTCLAPKIALLSQFVKLQEWLDPHLILASDDPRLVEWHQEMCKAARDIKKIANLSIHSDPHAKGNSPISVLNRFTKMLGLKFACVGHQTTGNQSRLYQLQSLDPDGRAVIFDRWLGKVPDPSLCKDCESDSVQKVIIQDPYKYDIQDANLVISKTVLTDVTSPFQDFPVGQKVRLWHDVLMQFVPSEIVKIVSGRTGFLQINHLNEFAGDYCFNGDNGVRPSSNVASPLGSEVLD